MIRFALVLLTSFSVNAYSYANATQLDNLHGFLDGKLLGKRLVSETVTGNLDDGRLQYEFQKVTIFNTLQRTSEGLKFFITYQIKQTNYRIVDEQRELPGIVKDRTLTERCDLRQPKSAPDKLIGFCQVLNSSTVDPTGWAKSLIVEFIPEGLMLHTQQILFIDHYADNEIGYKPGTSKTASEIKVENEKIVMTNTQYGYDFDLETLSAITETEKKHVVVMREE